MSASLPTGAGALELLKQHWVVGLAVAVTLTAPSSLPTTPAESSSTPPSRLKP